MKKTLTALIFMTCLCSWGLDFTGINLGHHGKYVWRGINFNNKPVSQGDVSFSHGNFGLVAWWNYDITNEKNGFTEVDYIVNYVVESDGVGFEGGFIYYNFPGAEEGDTREIYATFSVPYAFNPTFSIYQDIYITEGTYFQIGFSEDFRVKFKDYNIPVSLAVNLGFNSKKNWQGYYAEEGDLSGLSNIDITLSTSYDLSEDIVLEPYISYSALVNGAHNNLVNGDDHNKSNVWVGINLAVSF